MDYLVRALRRADDWAEVEDAPEWAQGDCPARTLQDFNAKNDELSVYLTTDNENSNTERIIAALAILRNQLDPFCYAILPEDKVLDIGIKIKKTKGSTHDQYVNNQHRDLIELNGSKLVELARLVHSEGSVENFDPQIVGDCILNSIKKQFFKREQLTQKIVIGLWRLKKI